METATRRERRHPAEHSAGGRTTHWTHKYGTVLVEVGPSRISGKGLFALTAIPVGTCITEYTGPLLSMAQRMALPQEKVKYLFKASEEYYIDGSHPANIARFINHSCEPNCKAVGPTGKVFIVAKRNIAPGEELSYNYGYPFTKRTWKRPCSCGASRCVGYIIKEVDREKLVQSLQQQQQLERASASGSNAEGEE
ncbi:SET (Su(var)3-9, Enhancer-of-zeste, Trithorax) domain [Balamuthia mandrillaris]